MQVAQRLAEGIVSAMGTGGGVVAVQPVPNRDLPPAYVEGLAGEAPGQADRRNIFVLQKAGECDHQPRLGRAVLRTVDADGQVMAGQPVDGVLVKPNKLNIGFGKAVLAEKCLDDARRGVRTPGRAHAVSLP